VVGVPAGFTVTAAYLGGEVHVLTASGDLDAATAPALRTELDRAWGEGAVEIVVDLLRVPFVDSVALGLLVEASKRTTASGGVFRVVCVDRRIARIIEITGLDRVLRLHPTLRDALESSEGRTLSAVEAST
jgi:anti-sigma B factor antagonist